MSSVVNIHAIWHQRDRKFVGEIVEPFDSEKFYAEFQVITHYNPDSDEIGYRLVMLPYSNWLHQIDKKFVVLFAWIFPNEKALDEFRDLIERLTKDLDAASTTFTGMLQLQKGKIVGATGKETF